MNHSRPGKSTSSNYLTRFSERNKVGNWTRLAANLQLFVGICQLLPIAYLSLIYSYFFTPLFFILGLGLMVSPFLLQGQVRRGNGGVVFVLLLLNALIMFGAGTVALSDNSVRFAVKICMQGYLIVGLFGFLSLIAAEIEIFRKGNT